MFFLSWLFFCCSYGSYLSRYRHFSRIRTARANCYLEILYVLFVNLGDTEDLTQHFDAPKSGIHVFQIWN